MAGDPHVKTHCNHCNRPMSKSQRPYYWKRREGNLIVWHSGCRECWETNKEGK